MEYLRWKHVALSAVFGKEPNQKFLIVSLKPYTLESCIHLMCFQYLKFWKLLCKQDTMILKTNISLFVQSFSRKLLENSRFTIVSYDIEIFCMEYAVSAFFFFFSFFLASLSHMELLSQGLDLSHSWDLCHSHCNAGFFNPLCWAGDRACDLVSAAKSLPIPLCHSGHSLLQLFDGGGMRY